MKDVKNNRNSTPVNLNFLSLLIAILFLVKDYNNINTDKIYSWSLIIAKYTFYLLGLSGLKYVVGVAQSLQSLNKAYIQETIQRNKEALLIFVVSAVTVACSQVAVFDEHFLCFTVAISGCGLFEMTEQENDVAGNTKAMISYGVGMACSFFEGYLVHIIPSDGAKFVGFEENIENYENRQNVVFPVRRLFIIITKSLYCPPDLKEFNNRNKQDWAYIEACQPLEGIVEKDVAGVKGRTYRNSAYKIERRDAAPVYLAAECATPLHTLRRVLDKRALYDELAEIDVETVVREFTSTLRSIIQRSRDTQDKCELVYFDDTDRSQNLADVLLDKIREIEPNFENIKRS